MKIFIKAASCISPQETFNQQFFSSSAKAYNSNFIKAIEPDYKTIIDPKLLRRMSRIVRTGLVAAIACLKESELSNVDAIITGTAYGCMEDSEKFLQTIVEHDETMLSPTSFIQSTHNTVAAQIALFLKCNAYNNTFVHRGFSFEHALIDTMLLLHEGSAKNILTGSAEEMTDFTFNVLRRFGMYKQLPVLNLDLYKSDSRGSIAGEGTAFFVLSNEASEKNYAELTDLKTFYKAESLSSVDENIKAFLQAKELSIEDIDLVVTGKNGDCKTDKEYDELQENVFQTTPVINYKHLCGEYPTSSSFAMWLVASIIKKQQLPQCFEDEKSTPKSFKKILIYNNYQNKYHSLILLSAINS